MTYYYDDYVAEEYGYKGSYVDARGAFITPDGLIFDLEGYSSTAHACGFVLPFFLNYIAPTSYNFPVYSKEGILENLIGWRNALRTKTYDARKAQQMRLDLIEYLIPVYQSKHTVFDYWDGVDLSYTTGLPKTVTEELFGKDRGLKDIGFMQK